MGCGKGGRKRWRSKQEESKDGGGEKEVRMEVKRIGKKK